MRHTLLTLTIASLLATTTFADPIHDAAQTGDLAGVQAELDKGVDANEVDLSFYNLTPLHWAISKGVAELLISEGADVNAITLEGSTPLHFAAWNGYKEIAEILIDNGADLNVINNKLAGTPFITALDWAIQQGRTEIADLLRKHGGKTSEELFALFEAARTGNIEAAKQAIADGIDVNAEDYRGLTPLHEAAAFGHNEVAELLIAKGAEVNAIIVSGGSNKNKTPLDFAVMKKQNETADLLRKHGGKTSEELNALIDAAKNGDIEAVKQHLAAGAGVNAKTGDGTTPLHNAAIYGHNEVAELLIVNGAEVNAIIVSGRNQGKTPLDLAIWRKKTETADLIRKHGGRTAEELALMPQLVYSKGPFDFSFTAKDGKTYVIEVTQDLKQWGELETIEGTGKQVKFIDPRQPLVPFKRNFYRVKLVE
jgi:ankyrin repeat protein